MKNTVLKCGEIVGKRHTGLGKGCWSERGESDSGLALIPC